MRRIATMSAVAAAHGTGSQAGRARVRSPRAIGTAAALAVALALPAAAGAAEPFVLDPGGMKPHVAVAENGTGHFVWAVRLAERRLTATRSATAGCRAARLPAPRPTVLKGSAAARTTGPRVLLHRDGRVIIIGEQSGLDQVAIVSSDGGDTFAAPREIGNQRPADIPSGFRAELGPGEDTVSI